MSVVALASRLPDPRTLREWSISLAALDVILSPDWESRYFSYDTSWSEGEEMASMRNGSGDEYSIVFGGGGVYIRGFDHESPLSPWAQPVPRVVPGLTDDVPSSLRQHVNEPAFSLDGIPALTVCVWRESSSPRWEYGRPTDPRLRDEDGGASSLFAELDGSPATYAAFATEYYEVEIAAVDVAAIFNRAPIDAGLVTRLNSDADYADVRDELVALGVAAE